MDLVIVESPAKAKTINKYLGNDYKVLASFGHVRDLPEKNGSVDPDEEFSMIWEVQSASGQRLNEIADYLKKSDRLILATDPDREGEAISWHVLEVMREKGVLDGKQIQRVVFNAITRNAVTEAMNHPRELDEKLVHAYLARRALDYLVGFNLSPVLWRKLPGARSAGRVQSVALKLICERELEIEKFIPREYWSVSADFTTQNGDKLPTRLTLLKGGKVEKFTLTNEAEAMAAKDAIETGRFKVNRIESKPGQRNPSAPFTTSTLQQEAARKLGFNAKRTMQIAQLLYQGIEIDGEATGLITYMRTDGTQIAPEAVTETRDVIKADFGPDYLPEKAREYQTKAANAQEAHEAIRPTSLTRRPEYIASTLDVDQAKLYELIWKRTMASQMENARVQRTTIDITDESEATGLRASGTVITFPGFLKLYEEGKDDEKSDKEEEQTLPQVIEGIPLDLQKVSPDQHFTEPPPRFSEATLVKKMEELGIGRPSTYASVLSVLRDRDYVFMDRNRFHPQDKGRLVTSFLESFFNQYVEYDFTAALEGDLDKVSNGDLDYKDVLRKFWENFSYSVDSTMEIRNTQILDKMNEVLGPHIFKDTGDGDPRICPKCNEGELSLKTGKFGAFVGCTRYPECRFTRPFAQAEGREGDIERELGNDPETGLIVYLKDGRFGPYIQLGDAGEDNEKPKRSGLPKDMRPADMTLDYALRLLSLPRLVGKHPETGEDITADLGRYGPYLKHGKQSASLETIDEIFEIGVNRAVTVIAEKKSKAPARGSSVIKELGEHPDDGKPVNIMNGRYGPYVKHNKINATIPKDEDPDSVTLERALELIAARAAKAGAGKKKAKKS
ncbi:Glutamyl-tRNA amidotransferase subunit A Glu-ADT subunit A protein [Candidatus Micropelagos thuwalensis]|uniref:DNA topoisomerase 1 n=1 Tax=Candidatus Micropelagius thuwalensis TaxID=1397666 RepID=U2WUN5_9PROT|nr:type I DNA topoisomerase [Candidatus Micropelagos thuwalensis]ERL47238.1 Glutamyl-tRNA amidotransferase subunit A Glu-ADT subunit A protein [Candidatus Micropelagos thuwalensis]